MYGILGALLGIGPLVALLAQKTKKGGDGKEQGGQKAQGAQTAHTTRTPKPSAHKA